VLRPLGPGGTRRCRPALVHAHRDAWLPATWVEVGPTGIAVVDGAFLLRPELKRCWEYLVWLAIDFATMLERARERDAVWVGSAGAVADRYRRRGIPTHRLYERSTAAPARAPLAC
jgi:uridine kinase